MPVKLTDKYVLSKHVIILTGATDGIGKEMARILSGYNPKRLILPARNMEKGNDLIEYIKSSNGHANNVEVWKMDLADLQSVKDFANKFIKEVGELHMLFNNAGVASGFEISKTKDNLEFQFQVNHLAPFLLTEMLLDTMKKSVTPELRGKIVFTTSGAHLFGEIDFDNLNLEKGSYWHPFKAYGNTKLMNVMTTKELSNIFQNDNIDAYSAHPGVIKSGMKNKGNAIISSIITVVMWFGGTAEQGAFNVLYPAFAESKISGNYYSNGIKEKQSNLVDDQELVKKLWNVSEQILKDKGMI